MKRIGFSLLSALLVSACTVGPDFQTPAPPAVTTYAAKGDAAAPDDQRIALGQRIAGDWWTGFQSPPLDGVIRQALSDNQDIEAARNRMAEAEEQVNAAEGALLPQVSLGANAGYQKYGRSLFGPLNFTVPPFAYYTAGPTVSFPLDLFGGEKRMVEQRRALLEYQSFELDAAYQSLTAHVAAEALALASVHAQIETLNGIIADDERNVGLVQSAMTAGSGTRVQLVTAQSQLAEDRALLPDLNQQQAVARHALAILAGKAPAEWSPPDFTLADFTLPGELPVRPAVGTGASPRRYPRRRGPIARRQRRHRRRHRQPLSQPQPHRDGDATGPGPRRAVQQHQQCLFPRRRPYRADFQRRELSAERRAAIDNYKASLAVYRQTILTAFGDVGDRLQALANDSDRLHAQAAAADTASQSLDLARRSYEAGNSGILDVIDAERRNAQAQLGLARARAQRLMDTVELYLALGGSPIAAPAKAQDAKNE